MKTLAIFGLLLAFSVSLFAQRSSPRGGGSHMAGGGSHMQVGGGSHFAAPTTAMRASSYYAPAYAPAYSSYYPASYGFGLPFASNFNTYTENPYRPMTIVSPALVSDPEPNVVFIPYYMRGNNGPSLAEIADQLKTERKPAKYIWRNVEPLLQAK